MYPEEEAERYNELVNQNSHHYDNLYQPHYHAATRLPPRFRTTRPYWNTPPPWAQHYYHEKEHFYHPRQFEALPQPWIRSRFSRPPPPSFRPPQTSWGTKSNESPSTSKENSIDISVLKENDNSSKKHQVVTKNVKPANESTVVINDKSSATDDGKPNKNPLKTTMNDKSNMRSLTKESRSSNDKCSITNNCAEMINDSGTKVDDESLNDKKNDKFPEEISLTKNEKRYQESVKTRTEKHFSIRRGDHLSKPPLWIKRTERINEDGKDSRFETPETSVNDNSRKVTEDVDSNLNEVKKTVDTDIIVTDLNGENIATSNTERTVSLETKNLNVIATLKHESTKKIKPVFLSERTYNDGKEKSWLWARKMSGNICLQNVADPNEKSNASIVSVVTTTIQTYKDKSKKTEKDLQEKRCVEAINSTMENEKFEKAVVTNQSGKTKDSFETKTENMASVVLKKSRKSRPEDQADDHTECHNTTSKDLNKNDVNQCDYSNLKNKKDGFLNENHIEIFKSTFNETKKIENSTIDTGHENIVVDTNGHDNTVVDTNGHGNTVVDTNCHENIALDTNCQENIALDTNVHENIVVDTNSHENIVADTNSHENIVADTNCQENIVVDTNGHENAVFDTNGHENIVVDTNDYGNKFVDTNCHESTVVATNCHGKTVVDTNYENVETENVPVENDKLNNVHATLLKLSSKKIEKSKLRKEELKAAISFKISQIGNKFNDTLKKSLNFENALKRRSQLLKVGQEKLSKSVAVGTIAEETILHSEPTKGTDGLQPTMTIADTFSPTPDTNAHNLFCPECQMVKPGNLIQHLINKHNYNDRSAELECSKQKILHLCRTKNIQDHLPLPCLECNAWFCDLECHIKTQHELESNPQEIERLKAKHWNGANTLANTHQNIQIISLNRCRECLGEFVDLKRHLKADHYYPDHLAELEDSKQCCFNKCLLKHKGFHQPLPCAKCNRWTCRLDKHLLKIHFSFIYTQRMTALEKGRSVHWQDKNLLAREILFPSHPTITSINPEDWVCYNKMTFPCPCCSNQVLNLTDHLVKSHGHEGKKAKFEHSKLLCLHICNTLHAGKHASLPCEECNEWSCRLDIHLKADHIIEHEEYRRNITDSLRKTYQDINNKRSTSKIYISTNKFKPKDVIYESHPSLTSIHPKDWVDYQNVKLLCPECTQPVLNLTKHLLSKHNYNLKNAEFEQSKLFCLHICQVMHKEEHVPLPCHNCNQWSCRLDIHLKDKHGEEDKEYVNDLLDRLKVVYWGSKKESFEIDASRQHIQTEPTQTPFFYLKNINKLDQPKGSLSQRPSNCNRVAEAVTKMWKKKLEVLSKEIKKKKKQEQQMELAAILEKGKQKHREKFKTKCNQHGVDATENQINQCSLSKTQRQNHNSEETTTKKQQSFKALCNQQVETTENYNTPINQCLLSQKQRQNNNSEKTTTQLKSCLKQQRSSTTKSCLKRCISFKESVDVRIISKPDEATFITYQGSNTLLSSPLQSSNLCKEKYGPQTYNEKLEGNFEKPRATAVSMGPKTCDEKLESNSEKPSATVLSKGPQTYDQKFESNSEKPKAIVVSTSSSDHLGGHKNTDEPRDEILRDNHEVRVEKQLPSSVSLEISQQDNCPRLQLNTEKPKEGDSPRAQDAMNCCSAPLVDYDSVVSDATIPEVNSKKKRRKRKQKTKEFMVDDPELMSSHRHVKSGNARIKRHSKKQNESKDTSSFEEEKIITELGNNENSDNGGRFGEFEKSQESYPFSTDPTTKFVESNDGVSPGKSVSSDEYNDPVSRQNIRGNLTLDYNGMKSKQDESPKPFHNNPGRFTFDFKAMETNQDEPTSVSINNFLERNYTGVSSLGTEKFTKIKMRKKQVARDDDENAGLDSESNMDSYKKPRISRKHRIARVSNKTESFGSDLRNKKTTPKRFNSRDYANQSDTSQEMDTLELRLLSRKQRIDRVDKYDENRDSFKNKLSSRRSRSNLSFYVDCGSDDSKPTQRFAFKNRSVKNVSEKAGFTSNKNIFNRRRTTAREKLSEKSTSSELDVAEPRRAKRRIGMKNVCGKEDCQPNDDFQTAPRRFNRNLLSDETNKAKSFKRTGKNTDFLSRGIYKKRTSKECCFSENGTSNEINDDTKRRIVRKSRNKRAIIIENKEHFKSEENIRQQSTLRGCNGHDLNEIHTLPSSSEICAHELYDGTIKKLKKRVENEDVLSVGDVHKTSRRPKDVVNEANTSSKICTHELYDGTIKKLTKRVENENVLSVGDVRPRNLTTRRRHRDVFGETNTSSDDRFITPVLQRTRKKKTKRKVVENEDQIYQRLTTSRRCRRDDFSCDETSTSILHRTNMSKRTNARFADPKMFGRHLTSDSELSEGLEESSNVENPPTNPCLLSTNPTLASVPMISVADIVDSGEEFRQVERLDNTLHSTTRQVECFKKKALEPSTTKPGLAVSSALNDEQDENVDLISWQETKSSKDEEGPAIDEEESSFKNQYIKSGTTTRHLDCITKRPYEDLIWRKTERSRDEEGPTLDEEKRSFKNEHIGTSTRHLDNITKRPREDFPGIWSARKRKRRRCMSMLEAFENDIETIGTVAKLFIRKAPQHEERLKKICKDVISEFSLPIRTCRSL